MANTSTPSAGVSREPTDGSAPGDPDHAARGGMRGWAIALLLVLIVAAIAGGAWLVASGTAAPMLAAIAPGRAGLVAALVAFACSSVLVGVAAAYVIRERFIASLMLVAPYLPGLAATVTVVAYLAIGPDDPTSSDAAYVGLVLGFGAWPFLALPLRDLCTVERAQTRTYLELVQRSRQLQDRLAQISPVVPTHAAGPCPPDDPCVEVATAHAEAKRQLDDARCLLEDAPDRQPLPTRSNGSGGRAIRWITGSGYVEVGRALHRAEEALIEIEPIEAVIGDALHDDLSLENSTIRDHDHLRDLIRVAIRKLDMDTATLAFPDTRAGGLPPTATLGDRSARAILREVRYAINDFRDKAKAGLVGAQTNLLWAIVFVASTAYLLMGLAVLVRISQTALIAACVFFLVGALVGLFNRLRIEAGRPNAVALVGLFQARLLHTPIVSGLAAVAGVFIVAASPSFFSALGAAGTGTTPAGSASVAALQLSLPAIFSLATNPSGLLVAAIFGLAPGNLTRTLGDQGASLEKALQRSEPASADTGGPA